jgi:hypothetical protein
MRVLTAGHDITELQAYLEGRQGVFLQMLRLCEKQLQVSRENARGKTSTNFWRGNEKSVIPRVLRGRKWPV